MGALRGSDAMLQTPFRFLYQTPATLRAYTVWFQYSSMFGVMGHSVLVCPQITRPFEIVQFMPAASISCVAGGNVVPDVDSASFVATLFEAVDVPVVAVVAPVAVVPAFVVVFDPLVFKAVVVVVLPPPPPPPPHAASVRLPAPASSPARNFRRDTGASIASPRASRGAKTFLDDMIRIPEYV
ncbi:hypothetical protein JCM10599A_58790 [Paraburkholderia kururiensis]